VHPQQQQQQQQQEQQQCQRPRNNANAERCIKAAVEGTETATAAAGG